MALVWLMVAIAAAFAVALLWFLRPGRAERLERASRLPLDDQPEEPEDAEGRDEDAD